MSRSLQGALLALLATFHFSLAAALAKEAAAIAPVLQILFVRQLFVLLSTLPVLAARPEALRTRRPGLHALRLTGAFTALACGFWAVAVLPLTTATVLAFAQVFFVTLIAGLALGERVGPVRLAAIALGFLGVLVAMRPGAEALIDLNALIPVLGAAGAAVAITSVRVLSQSDRSETILLYQALVVGLPAAAALPWIWAPLDLWGWALLSAIGAISALGQWIGVAAIRRAEAGLIAGLEYAKLIHATILGALLFGEVPDGPVMIGAALITASGFIILWRERGAR